jgi:uncharacterized protein YciI
MAADGPKIRYVVFHKPGPAWAEGVDFREQAGVEEHMAHYQNLYQQGNLELGGPFLLPDLGGMMIATRGYPMEDLIAFAAQDPAVHSGLLEYEVRPWFTAMDRLSG